MREIKFRGKRIGNGEWVYGDLLQGLENDSYIVISNENGVTKYEVDPDTVGQFTGLQDKNGKEIYEGDIIKMTTEIYGEEFFRIGYENSHIGAFCLCGEGIDNVSRFVGIFGRDCGYEPFYCDVIGNIHDNPELLKGGQE